MSAGILDKASRKFSSLHLRSQADVVCSDGWLCLCWILAAAGDLEAFLTTCQPNISSSCEAACMKERRAVSGVSYGGVCRPFQKVLVGGRAAPQAPAAFHL